MATGTGEGVLVIIRTLDACIANYDHIDDIGVLFSLGNGCLDLRQGTLACLGAIGLGLINSHGDLEIDLMLVD